MAGDERDDDDNPPPPDETEPLTIERLLRHFDPPQSDQEERGDGETKQPGTAE